MYPEAGGSSSFARRAFNEFWSFFAAWAGMLTYTVTISISAFFVPHYLGGLFWEALRHGPGDTIAGCIVVAVLACINVFGVKESTGINVTLAVVDFMTQLLLVLHRPVRRVLAADAGRQHPPRDRADVERLHPGDPDRHAGLHGDRDRLEHGRGGQERGGDDPGGDQSRADRRLRDLLHAAGRRAVGAAGDADGLRRVPDPARPDRGGGRLRGRPGARRGQADGPRALPARRGDLRRPARRDDPLPGHQRRDHRRLAARLLDGHPPPDARLAAPAAPALPHAVDRHPRVQRRRHRADPAGPGGPARPDLLLRRAAVVHDGPRGRRAAASQASRRRSALPRARQHQDRRLRRAAVRDRRRHVHGDRVRRDRRAEPQSGRDRHRVADRRHRSSTRSTAAARAST